MKHLFILISTLLFLSCTQKQKNQLSNNISNAPTKVSDIRPVAYVVKTKHNSYNPKLLPSLKYMINELENGNVDYKWTDFTSCNVGLFAQLATNLSAGEISDKVNKEYDDYIKYTDKDKNEYQMSWKRMTNYYCGVTGKSTKGVINDLNKLGFKSPDIGHLEFLSDPYILSYTDIDTTQPSYFADKNNLIKYLKAWGAILQKETNSYQ